MPRRIAALSALAVKQLKNAGLHAVGGVDGLYLSISKQGNRSWILRIVIGGSRREMGLGSFPEVPLADARRDALAARERVRAGANPINERRERNAAAVTVASSLTFAEAYEQFLTTKKLKELSNAKHRDQWRSTFGTYVRPKLGTKPVAVVSTDDILSVLKPIWSTKTETASRIRGRLEKVLSWAKKVGLREGENPAIWKDNLEHLLPTPEKIKKVEHQPAVKLADAPRWMARLQRMQGMGAIALKFLALTACRSGEIRGATWDEFDLPNRIWIIPAARMKMDREHRVPLTDTMLAELKSVPRFEGSPYVFPATRGGTLSDMTLSAVMRRMHTSAVEEGEGGFIDRTSGRPAVPHGLRSTWREWAAEKTDYPREMAEIALAHAVGNAVERAYLRSDMLDKRRQMMVAWEKFLMGE